MDPNFPAWQTDPEAHTRILLLLVHNWLCTRCHST